MKMRNGSKIIKTKPEAGEEPMRGSHPPEANVSKHSPLPKKASAYEDEEGQWYFVYSNGQKGDIQISVLKEEVPSWEKIIKACNAYPKLVELLKRANDCLHSDFKECKAEIESLLKKLGEV